MDYVKDTPRAYAIPILAVTEYPGVSQADLAAELGKFHPPQGYVRLTRHRPLRALCEKMIAASPVREMRVRPPA
jgi:hypothetical protein